jgi:MFS family permease
MSRMFNLSSWKWALSAWRNLLHLPREAGVDDEIARNFPRNFVVNSLDSVSWILGDSFISITTILPVYARHLTSSTLVIGLIPALADLGWFLPQMFMAPLVERRPRKYPLVIGLGALERLPYLVLPFAVFWLNGLPRASAVGFFILLMAWKSTSSGIVAIPWQEMIAKIIPVSHRGRFFGVSQLSGQVIGVAGAALAGLLLAHFAYPLNFALCFGASAFGVWLSYFFLSQVREPARQVPPEGHARGQYGKRLLKILRSDANFRTYLVSRWFSYLGGMATGFIALYAVIKYSLPDSTAGVFTGILFAAGAVGYLVWGPLGDRLGHKHVMELSALLWAAALGTALATAFFPMPWGLYLVFVLLGVSSAGNLLSDLSMAMEFGPEGERPTYIGLARSLTGPALFIAPLLAGWVIQSYGYAVMFSVSLLFCLTGLWMLRQAVQDPRFLERGAISSLKPGGKSP